MATGRSTAVAGVDEQRRRVYFTGNLDTPLEHHLYWVDLDRPGAPRRVTEPGWWNNAEMDEAATRALVTRSSPAQPPQVYLADADGPPDRLDRGEPARRVASLRALPRQPCRADLRHDPRRATAPSSTTGCCRRRASRAGAIRSSSRSMAGPGPGGRRPAPGPARSSNIWSSMAGSSSRSTIAARPTAARRSRTRIYRAMGSVEVQDQLAGVAWLRGQDYVDPRPHRGLRLVLWRLHDAEAARGGAGHLRRRRRRRAGHPLGAVRHPLYRALSRQSRDRSRALSGVGRDPQCRPHRRSAAAGPRHGRRQCRVREFDGADGRAPGRRPPVRDDGLSRRHPWRLRRGPPAPSLADDHPLPRPHRAARGQQS